MEVRLPIQGVFGDSRSPAIHAGLCYGLLWESRWKIHTVNQMECLYEIDIAMGVGFNLTEGGSSVMVLASLATTSIDV